MLFLECSLLLFSFYFGKLFQFQQCHDSENIYQEIFCYRYVVQLAINYHQMALHRDIIKSKKIKAQIIFEQFLFSLAAIRILFFILFNFFFLVFGCWCHFSLLPSKECHSYLAYYSDFWIFSSRFKKWGPRFSSIILYFVD